MARSGTRKNEPIARYLAAMMLAVVTWFGLHAMPFYPPWLEFALALGVGVLAAFSAATASLAFVIVLALPVARADLVAGIAFLLLGLVATQYLSVGRAGGFLLVVLGVAAVPLHAEWAAVALAGYLLGRGKGALTAVTVLGCIAAVGMALGVPTIGTVATGGSAPGLVSFAADAGDALSFSWLAPALSTADPGRAFDAVTGISQPLLLGAEALLWGIAGAIGALSARAPKRVLALAGPAASIALLALGSLALDAAFAGPLTASRLLTTAAVSLPLALAGTAIAAWVFPVQVTQLPKAPAGAPRDVDDLLRTIAAAEDELASRHTTEAVVLITDMKSFSAMTEEIGSVASAKIVQRHRDLLLPIIAANKGKGTATGGDGLVAAFGSATDAVIAASAMQAALEGYTGSDRSPHELSVRIGIASGEVVLDQAGCPFLGGALNLAARVMDLADGGRVMMTGAVAAAGGAPERLHAHGEFKLKNIAEAVPVIELLWRDGMLPQEIRAS